MVGVMRYAELLDGTYTAVSASVTRLAAPPPAALAEHRKNYTYGSLHALGHSSYCTLNKDLVSFGPYVFGFIAHSIAQTKRFFFFF